jgi:hypothetical protein
MTAGSSEKAIPTSSRVQRAARNQLREDQSAPQTGHPPAAGLARTEMLSEDIRTPPNFDTCDVPQRIYGETIYGETWSKTLRYSEPGTIPGR